MNRKELFGIAALTFIFNLTAWSVDLSEYRTKDLQPKGIPYRFEKDGRPIILYRTELKNLPYDQVKNLPLKTRVGQLIQSVIAGPVQIEKSAGIESVIPEGTLLHEITMPNDRTVHIVFEFPEEFIRNQELTGYRIYKIGRQFEPPLEPIPILNIFLYVWDAEKGEAIDIQNFIHDPEIPIQDTEKVLEGTMERKTQVIPSVPDTQRTGFLNGKTVFIDEGHGWFDDFTWSGNRWRVQRGVVSDYGILEDFSNGETIHLYTSAYLMNAGANVFTCREPDHQTGMVIVDNDDGTGNPSNGTYTEEGSWINSSLRCFKQKTTSSWVGWANPFRDDAGNDHENRLAQVSSSGVTARAIWIPNIPEAGYYNVYVSWSRYTSRATDAQYLVKHPGGTTEFRVNQQEFGFTWYLLGRFYFEAGLHPETGAVVLTNYASSGYVSADAVRFGGGMGDVERRTNGVSGRPRWEEDSVYYLQFSGAHRTSDGSGYDYFLSTGDDDESNGWNDRPQMARWLNQYCGESAYMAHHTNAGGGTGTRTYLHSSASTDSGSLRDFMHEELVNDIRRGYDSGWVDYKKSGNYGENNQDNLGAVPGYLMESLFHDHAEDTRMYRDPKFRMIMGRAFYQGFAKYFASKAGVPVKLLPEPPTHLVIRNQGSGSVELSWRAPQTDAVGLRGDSATGYKVYQSTHGKAFDNGTATSSTSTVISGLTPGELYYFRVSATNEGGESFPTETLACGVGHSTGILLVNGADRFDRYLPPRESVVNAGEVVWMDPILFNTFDYTIQHGKAIHAAGYSFDAASNEAVEDNDINLAEYQSVIWIGGQEAESDTEDNEDNTSLKAGMRTQLEQLLKAGGNLMISGSEIGWDIARDSGPTQDEKDFYRDYLKATYSGDDANTFQVQGSSGIFTGLGSFNIDNGSQGTYEVRFPDQLSGNGGSVPCMSYIGGNGGNAAIEYTGTFGGSLQPAHIVYLGFPFETVVSESIRNEIMDRVLDLFDLIIDTPTPTNTPDPRFTATMTPTQTLTPTITPTPTETPIPQIYIVDNEDGEPRFTTTGSWSVSSSYPPYYGQNCVFADASSSGITASAIFRPNLPLGGVYEVRAYWREGSNRSLDAPYTIHDRNGATTVRVNQQMSVSVIEFFSLGTYEFDAGDTGYVELTNDANSSVIMADAVMFKSVQFDSTPTPSPIPTETPGSSGVWQVR